MQSKIIYKKDANISVDVAIELYNSSTLGQRRPVDRPDIFKKMLDYANLTITAWDQDKVVGIARTLTDFAFVAYLADLAVHIDYQRKGIGKELIRQTKLELQPECKIVLLAAPQANKYYEKIGFEHNPRAWVLK